MDFTISLAEVKIRIKSLYDEVDRLCRDYRTDFAGTAELTVEIKEEDIIREREKLAPEGQGTLPDPPEVSDSYLETLAVYRKIAEALVERNIWLMHGTAVCIGGKTVLFTAPSGTGKSTHAKLWLSCFPDAFVINGDKPLIQRSGGRYFVCGTPWAGKEGWNSNTREPLKAICLLERDCINRIRKISFREALPFLIRQSFRPEDKDRLAHTLELIRGLEETVTFFRLGCNMEPEAAQTAYRGIFSEDTLS